MASAKREAPEDDEAEALKKPKLEEPKPKRRVVLNPADCNLGISLSFTSNPISIFIFRLIRYAGDS